MVKKAAGWMIFLVGTLILILSAWYAFEATRFLGGTEPTMGEVVDHEFTGGLNTGYREVGSHQTKVTAMYAPIVEFQTTTGSTVRFRANWSEGDPPPVGSSVSVRYPTQYPENARISGISSLFGGAAILFLLGVIFAGAGILILWKRSPAKPSATS